MCIHVLLLLATSCSGPDASALRLVLLGELVSAAGFTRDRLYLEWQLVFDPEVWLLQHSEQAVVQPGLIQVSDSTGATGTRAGSCTVRSHPQM